MRKQLVKLKKVAAEHKKLEQKLRKHSAELKKLNTSLQAEIKERQQAEQLALEKELFLSNIFASIQDGISILDDNLNIIAVNPTMERWYAHNVPLKGKKCYFAYHGRHRPCKICPTQQTIKTGKPAMEVAPKTGPGGKVTGWLELFSFPLVDQRTKKISGVIEYVRDISERRLAEEAIHETEKQYRMMIDAMSDAIHMVDENLRILLINKTFRDWNKKLGFPSDVIGHTPFEIYPFLTENIRKEYQWVLATGKTLVTEESQTIDGKTIITETRKIPILEGDKVTRIVTVIRDITEQRRMEEELRALSLVDELTGLYNRRGFFTLAQQQLKLAARLKRNTVLIFADMDNLKWINDTFGHTAGDHALKEMAHILKHTFREADIVARLGGDEFVVLAVEVNNDANILIQRLLGNLQLRNARIKAHPPSPSSPVFDLSVSIGIACCTADNPCSLEELLSQADKNMYQQKRHKQNSKG